jgi:hypothetical protein
MKLLNKSIAVLSLIINMNSFSASTIGIVPGQIPIILERGFYRQQDTIKQEKIATLLMPEDINKIDTAVVDSINGIVRDFVASKGFTGRNSMHIRSLARHSDSPFDVVSLRRIVNEIKRPEKCKLTGMPIKHPILLIYMEESLESPSTTSPAVDVAQTKQDTGMMPQSGCHPKVHFPWAIG